MSAEFVLPSDFWPHFVKRHWGQSPLVIKQPFARSLATAEEAFSAIRHAADQFRASEADVRFRFYREDDFSLQPETYLPEPSDQSVADYAARVTRKLNGQCFGLILNSFQAYDAELWQRVREFLRGLLTEISLQPLVDGVVFFGNYDKTPLGIHKDPVDIFLFVIEGHKKMYLWPEEFFQGGDDDARLASDFAVLRQDALILEGEPGDVIYWPASFWHVAESVGGLSLSLSLALEPLRPSRDILDYLKKQIEEFVNAALAGDHFPTTAEQLEASAEMISEVTQLAIKALRKSSRDADFARELQVSWLKRLTGTGSDPVPPPLPWKELADDALVQGCPEYPILWIPLAKHHLACSANGHAFTIPADPKTIALLKRLNRGEVVQVKRLIEEHTGVTKCDGVEFNTSPEGIRTVLSKLYSFRAISEQTDGPSTNLAALRQETYLSQANLRSDARGAVHTQD
ncbi:MAG: JmjC domain-containing protein [Pyrinomonadaceae bacterium]